MPDEQRLEEQVLSQAVESQLNNQFEQSEDLDVQVHTDLLKAVQGQADSVAVAGKGVVVQPGVRIEAMELQTDLVSINPLSVLLGQVKLNQPVNTTARMVMTEADINQAMNSDYVRDKLSAITLNVEGQDVPLELQPPMSIDLQTPGKLGFNGTVLIHEPTGDRQVGFSAVICPPSPERPLTLEAFQCLPGQGLSLVFTIALLQKVQEILQSPYLEVEGMALRVKEMVIEAATLILQAEAHVYELPQT